jgi:hypothetical protein
MGRKRHKDKKRRNQYRDLVVGLTRRGSQEKRVKEGQGTRRSWCDEVKGRATQALRGSGSRLGKTRQENIL